MRSELRRCLEDGDVAQLARLWRRMYPGLPQPRDHRQARVALHRARTEARSISLAKRLYSHAWLVERGLPSGLPPELRPPRERFRPIIVEAVGISVMARNPNRRETARAIQDAMSAVVAECYAEGVTDPPTVSRRMWEARDRILRGE